MQRHDNDEEAQLWERLQRLRGNTNKAGGSSIQIAPTQFKTEAEEVDALLKQAHELAQLESGSANEEAHSAQPTVPGSVLEACVGDDDLAELETFDLAQALKLAADLRRQELLEESKQVLSQREVRHALGHSHQEDLGPALTQQDITRSPGQTSANSRSNVVVGVRTSGHSLDTPQDTGRGDAGGSSGWPDLPRDPGAGPSRGAVGR